MGKITWYWYKVPLSNINHWSSVSNVSHISILGGMFALKASCWGFTNTRCTQVGCEALTCKGTTSLYVTSTFPLNAFFFFFFFATCMLIDFLKLFVVIHVYWCVMLWSFRFTFRGLVVQKMLYFLPKNQIEVLKSLLLLLVLSDRDLNKPPT